MSASIVTALMVLHLAVGVNTDQGVRETMVFSTSENMQRLMPKALPGSWRAPDEEDDFVRTDWGLQQPEWVPHDQPTPHRDGVRWMKLQL